MLLERAMPEAAAVPGRRERMLSICFVAPHAWPALSGDARHRELGGAEVQQALLARQLAARGHRVTMICIDYGQPEGARVDGVTVLRCFRKDAGLPVLRFAHPRLTSMWRALAAASADVYYCRSASMWIGVVAEYARRNGARAVYAGASDKDFVEGLGGQIRLARDRWLFRRGMAAADAIVAQNEFQRSQCLATYGREPVVIPSCYALPRGAARGQGEQVLWVGMLHANKRPELFVELAARLPRRRFVMIGGPRAGDRGFYEAMATRARGVPNLEFCGFLPFAEVEKRFDRARVLVNTSEYEGMPNTFLQAWARGVPTVATVDAGAPGHKGVRGIEDLQEEVEKLFREEPWKAASRACRAYFARNHSCEEAIARYEDLFDHILETPRSPSARFPLHRGAGR
jgi:glycosyltransferase involved in cell wall biosynthesis